MRGVVPRLADACWSQSDHNGIVPVVFVQCTDSALPKPNGSLSSMAVHVPAPTIAAARKGGGSSTVPVVTEEKDTTSNRGTCKHFSCSHVPCA